MVFDFDFNQNVHIHTHSYLQYLIIAVVAHVVCDGGREGVVGGGVLEMFIACVGTVLGEGVCLVCRSPSLNSVCCWGRLA